MGLKISIGLYIVCIVGLIGSYFAISNRHIRHAVYARSSPHWTLGKSNYLRVAFLDVVTGKTYNRGKATLTVADSKKVETPQFGYVAFNIQPEEATDSATLDFDIGSDSIHLDFPIKIQKSGVFNLPPASTRRAKEDKKQRIISEWVGEDTIEIIPETAEIVRGLSNEVYFITRRKGVPQAMTFRILSHEGVIEKLPSTITSNIFGVGKITINPTTSLRLELESVINPEPGGSVLKTVSTLKTASTPSKGKINIFAVATQFNFKTQTPYVAYNDIIRGRVKSMRQSGAILVDGYERDRWVSGAVFGLNKQGGGFELKSAKEGKLMQVQVYHNFYLPGSSWASRWVAIGESKHEGDYCHIFKTLAGDLKKASVKSLIWANQVLELPAFERATQQECKFLLRVYLDALPISFVNSHTIINSREKDLKKLSQWKEKKKSQFKWVIGIFLTGGFFCILWMVLIGIKRKKQFQRDLEDIGDDENLPEDRFENILFYLRILTILTALATFIASMLMIMSFM